MQEFAGNKGIYDGVLFDLSEIETIKSENFSIYEILRIEQNVPLFLQAHLDRLFLSISLERLEIKENHEELISMVHKLIQANDFQRGKIKFVYNFPEYPDSENYHYLIYFTGAEFPETHQYEDGVEVGFCSAVRDDPNAKVLNTEARKTADQKIQETNVFEVLLLDNEGFVTEGSRSNVFFVFDDRLVTPPDEAVLQGIARKNVLEICQEHDIPVDIRKVHQSELKQAKSVFLTGTSLKILPVRKVNNISYLVKSKLLKFLMSKFDQKVERQISDQKRH